MWRDRLRQNAWLNAPFEYVSHTINVGWRLQTHQYPERDTPWTQNLGRDAESLTVVGYVSGHDYDIRRDAVLKAAREGSTGTLVLSRVGPIQAELKSCSCAESVADGGKATFTFQFVEPGKRELPAWERDTSGLLASSVQSVESSARDDFDESFSLPGFPSFVTDDALSTLTAGLDALRSFNGRVAGVIAPFSEVAGRIDDIGSELRSLVLSPRSLVNSIVDVARSSFGVLQSVDGALAGYKHVSVVFASVDPVVGDTPSRVRQRENRAAIIRLFNTVCLAEMVSSVAVKSIAIDVLSNKESPFDSYNHAIAVRDDAAALIEFELLVAPDRVYAELQTLRKLLVEHIAAHGSRLERVREISLESERPVLALAHDLYGGIDNVDDLVRRNQFSHPGFVPAGRVIEILNA